MKNFNNIILTITLVITGSMYSQKNYKVEAFDKIIISPHIEATIVQGDEESVTIESASLDEDKINIEVHGKNLRVYLDNAKELTKQEKVSVNGHVTKKPIYNGTMAVVTIIYKNIDELSIRGEEKFTSKSDINVDDFELKIYGESQNYFSSINVKNLEVAIYGEAELYIESGSADEQKYTAYGECKVDALNLKSSETKIIAHGEAQFDINAEETLKVTSYGEPTIRYSGNPQIKKGISLGDVKITNINN